MYSKIEIFLVNTSREKLGRIEKQKERNKEARDIVLIIIIYHMHAIKENLEGEKKQPNFYYRNNSCCTSRIYNFNNWFQ